MYKKVSLLSNTSFPDVTERKWAKEKIQQQNEFLNNILDSLTHPFYVIDANDYTIKMANPAAKLGNLLENQTCHVLTHKSVKPCGGVDHVCPLEEVKKTKKPVIVEHIHYDKNGSARNIEVHGYPIFDSEGNVIQMIECCLDITERKRMEKALRESEERLRILFEFAPDAYYLNDLKGNFIDGNKAAEEITGYKKDELIGKSFLRLKLLPPKQIPKAATLLAKNALGQSTGPDEFTLDQKDGTQVPVEIRTFPVKIKDKTLVLGIARDITERKQAEEALRESNRRFRDIAENAFEWIWEVDANGKYTYVSPFINKILGYNPEEVLKKHFYDLFHPDDREELKKAAFEVFAKKQPFREFMNRNVHKNGKTVWLSTSGVPILDKEGNFLGYRGADTDITERKRAEERLRESEGRYRLLAENVTDIIWTTDMNLRFTYISPSAEYLSGYSVDEAMALTLAEVLTHASLEVTIKAFAEELAIENVEQKNLSRSRTLELEFRRKDGSTVWGEVKITFLRDPDSQVVGLLGVARDITERKRIEKEIQEKNEELAEASRAKSEFLAHMSHELRTPLNVIIGFSELMMDELPGEVNEEQGQCLSDILGSGQHLLSLINDILDLSKIESGKMELKLTNIALPSVIESLRREIMPVIGKREQSLDVEVEEGLPLVRGDKVKVRQVLLNLLSNAAKFTPDGGKLKVEATRNGDWCQVSVVDRGIGIKKEDQEKIFEPFSQLDDLQAEGRGGTGLGLTLARQIIEKHGGRMWVESKYRKGSKFSFTLPLATADEPHPRENRH